MSDDEVDRLLKMTEGEARLRVAIGEARSFLSHGEKALPDKATRAKASKQQGDNREDEG